MIFNSNRFKAVVTAVLALAGTSTQALGQEVNLQVCELIRKTRTDQVNEILKNDLKELDEKAAKKLAAFTAQELEELKRLRFGSSDPETCRQLAQLDPNFDITFCDKGIEIIRAVEARQREQGEQHHQAFADDLSRFEHTVSDQAVSKLNELHQPSLDSRFRARIERLSFSKVTPLSVSTTIHGRTVDYSIGAISDSHYVTELVPVKRYEVLFAKGVRPYWWNNSVKWFKAETLWLTRGEINFLKMPVDNGELIDIKETGETRESPEETRRFVEDKLAKTPIRKWHQKKGESKIDFSSIDQLVEALFLPSQCAEYFKKKREIYLEVAAKEAVADEVRKALTAQSTGSSSKSEPSDSSAGAAKR